MLKPIKFVPSITERQDPNFVAFADKVRHKSKKELLYMCFLAVEALAARDFAEANKETKEEPTNDK